MKEILGYIILLFKKGKFNLHKTLRIDSPVIQVLVFRYISSEIQLNSVHPAVPPHSSNFGL